jgi:hypothetical protein
VQQSPDPIEIYDDAAERKAAPPPRPPVAKVEGRVLAEFECVAGAVPETDGLKSAPGDRPGEDGQTISVTNYDPTGIRVFGFEAGGLERFREASGRAGVAAYVPADMRSTLRAVLARFPGASSADGIRVNGPGLAGTISLQEAAVGSQDLTRIECAPAI